MNRQSTVTLYTYSMMICFSSSIWNRWINVTYFSATGACFPLDIFPSRASCVSTCRKCREVRIYLWVKCLFTKDRTFYNICYKLVIPTNRIMGPCRLVIPTKPSEWQLDKVQTNSAFHTDKVLVQSGCARQWQELLDSSLATPRIGLHATHTSDNLRHVFFFCLLIN